MDDLHEIVPVDEINLLPVICNNLNMKIFGQSQKMEKRCCFCMYAISTCLERNFLPLFPIYLLLLSFVRHCSVIVCILTVLYMHIRI